MRTIFQGYTLLHADTPVFFAGANTGRGFVGAYDTFAMEEDIEHIWILKGGSGTGKSTLMHKVAAEAEEAGHSCVRYLCSSDPLSLDAVVMDGRYVILDGTAPHVWEMTYPGAVSEIVYLGKYWHSEKLAAHREEIIGLTKSKKESYTKGYSVLAALSTVEAENYQAMLSLLDIEKLRLWGERLLRKVPKDARQGGCTVVRTRSIGMRGLYRTDGLAYGCTQHWRIEDAYGTALWLFAVLAELCQQAQIPVVLSLHPINDRIVEMAIPALSLHLTLAETETDAGKTICMQRFLRKELPDGVKGSLRLTHQLMTEMLALALDHFVKAGDAHMALEEIYKSTMDFPKLNREMAVFRKQLLSVYRRDEA